MKNIWKIIRLAKPLYGLFFGLSAIIFVGAITNLAAPFFSKLIVDEIVAHVKTGSGDIRQLVIYVLGSFFVSLLGIVLQSISNRMGDRMAGRLYQYLTEVFYKNILGKQENLL
jgi:ABC-type multidrug transport system fused ATPase/permease subunit